MKNSIDREEIERRQSEAREVVRSLRLQWQCTPSTAEGFHAEYTIENAGPRPVFVLSETLALADGEGFERVPEGAARKLSEDGATLLLILGYVPAESLVMFRLMPGAQTLAPGEQSRGRVFVPFPLRTWHPQEGAELVRSAPAFVQLQVGILPDFCTLKPLALNGGEQVMVPLPAEVHLYQQWLTGDVLPMPAPV